VHDITFIESEFDSEPLVRVTLTAAEVSGIFSALFTRAKEHTDRVFEHVTSGKELDPQFRGVEAQAESNMNVGVWQAVDDMLGARFWAWIGEEDCECGGE
jgi:hypothetical protein